MKGRVPFMPQSEMPARLPTTHVCDTPSTQHLTAARVRSVPHDSIKVIHSKTYCLLAEMNTSSKPWQGVSVVRQGRHPGTSSYPHTVSCFYSTRLPMGGAPH